MTLNEAADIILETRKTGGETIPNDNVAELIDAMWSLLQASMDGEDIRPLFTKK